MVQFMEMNAMKLKSHIDKCNQSYAEIGSRLTKQIGYGNAKLSKLDLSKRKLGKVKFLCGLLIANCKCHLLIANAKSQLLFPH